MRLLLFIPTIILFLANIPFKMEIKMDEKVCEMMKEEMDCPMKQEASMNSCHKTSDTKPSCHKTQEQKEEKDQKNEDNTCTDTGITCVCICCFQYSAPANSFTVIDFNLLPQKNSLTGFIHSIWEDPQLSPPWQPPDGMTSFT